MQDGIAGGYICTDLDGSLRYVSLDNLSCSHTHTFTGMTTGYFTASATQTLEADHSWGIHHSAGHEAAGPQKTDAKSTSDALCDVLQGWATALVAETRGREVDNAISALHRQHTRDGRPSRFMQETE